MEWLDRFKRQAIKNSHTGGPFSMACAGAISKLEQKRYERKAKKLENDCNE